jgi:hypothetical protein
MVGYIFLYQKKYLFFKFVLNIRLQYPHYILVLNKVAKFD